ncbi:hypothetical protein ACQQ2T_05215 [Paraclostridium tenue]|uniref:Uncharacterized protein n=1 Tax=Paeniclostridium hominis TaxID=2764329 RepID=A0ABR7K0S1_9FIRM|nr:MULTISPECIES: hypothetical protein [Paeniclostridium]MBC6002708.1 hypothetical protein [Paeniclostridium hominis]MDU1538561.1 hypothetical protein [Paeniclostridium sordellii]
MSELLINLNSDIKRCEEVLRMNNYLEIVIVLEEIIDKYNDKIDNIAIENDRVWNYSKKDLENITDKLIVKRDEIINEYIYNSITIDSFIKNIEEILLQNKNMSEDKKHEVLDKINEIYNIYKVNIDKNLKWEELKIYLIWASKQDLYISKNIIELINLVIKSLR